VAGQTRNERVVNLRVQDEKRVADGECREREIRGVSNFLGSANIGGTSVAVFVSI
jgi:hypothetical protein